MSFLTFIFLIIIFILIINLRLRVKELEKLVQKGVNVKSPETSDKKEGQQQTQAQVFLLDYIKKHLEKGVNKEEIKSFLLSNGWQEADIENAFNNIATPNASLKQEPYDRLQTGPTFFERFISWVKEDWLLKLGALLLIIGFGWFTTYAFLNNWIGPVGRITLGIIAGVLFILLGYWRIKNYVTQGGVFLVLGSTTILLTIFAARTIYDFFTPISALIVMFLSTAFVALASVKYKSRALSIISLLLAGVSPLLAGGVLTDYTWVFAYLFIVILGAIWIVMLTGQRELTAISLIIVSLYSAPYLLSFNSIYIYRYIHNLVDIQTLLLYAYAFSALFFLTNTTGLIKLNGKKLIPDLITAAGNGLFLLTWIMFAAQDEWKSLIIVAWMIVFSAGAFVMFKITRKHEPFYVYTGVGIAMLAAATALELHGAALTIAYTIESAIIALIAYLILNDIKIAEKASLLLIGPIILSFDSMSYKAWVTGVFNKDFFVLLILGITMLGLGLFFLSRAKETDYKESLKINTPSVLLITGSVYMYILLWLSLHAGLSNNNVAVMISLVTYTIIGLITYLYGIINENRALYIYGGALIGFVVGRLLLIDVWQMELTGRIITFFIIGALLMSTAFLGRKNLKINK